MGYTAFNFCFQIQHAPLQHGGTYLKMTPTHWMAYGKQYRAVIEMIEAGALQPQNRLNPVFQAPYLLSDAG
jgi:hypothetical protein